MLSIFYFLVSNYILVVLSSMCLALVFNYGKQYDKDDLVNMAHAEVETKNIVRELIIAIIFIVTVVRIRFMSLNDIEVFQYFAVGTLGTLLLRAIATNITVILTLLYNEKIKDKIQKSD